MALSAGRLQVIRMLRQLLVPLPVALALTASPAASELSREDVRAAERALEACELSGWSSARSRQGLAVRAGPSGRERTLGRIPHDPGKPDEDYRGFGIPFRIIGSRNGWLRIRNAVDYYDRPALRKKAIFAGEGWVWGGYVGFAVQSGRVRAIPERNAPVLREMRQPALQQTE
jgi:hypothetical protein